MTERSSTHRIHVARAEHKFSCAHMTVFPDGRIERLHGHNYTVAVALDLAEITFERIIDFSAIKREVAAVCAAWRERTLVAEHNPILRVAVTGGGTQVELTAGDKRYLLPRDDVLLLPVDNTTVEALSAHWADLLADRLARVLDKSAAVGLEITIEETPGQGAATYLWLHDRTVTSTSEAE